MCTILRMFILADIRRRFMYAQVKSGSLYGLQSEMVLVEVDLSPGLPGLTIVGLPDISVKESRERIRSAILNSGYRFPSKRMTINLVPAGNKKEGTHFDLPIAIGIMASIGMLDHEFFSDFAFLGELSLDGKINGITGALPLVIGLRNQGIKKILLPLCNVEEASIIQDVDLYPVSHLIEVVEFLNGENLLKYYQRAETTVKEEKPRTEDFSEVAGQESVKRALQLSAAGVHNLLMIGPPGAGKTMMARRMPGILPEMTYEERLEVTKIYSIAGLLSEKMPMITESPFRAPHHTISGAALIGGGSYPKPGEVSLAHFGVLFLDELPEFSRQVLELLRQPMENEEVIISRVRGKTNFPAKNLVLAAMNPCPCGFSWSDTGHKCTCTQSQIKSYLSKLSGPLLDRMDIHIEILPVKYEAFLADEGEGFLARKSSAAMKREVEQAREIQALRYREEDISYNSQLAPGLIKKYCTLDRETKRLLGEAYKRLSLSARAHNKIIKLSRTIADMEGAEQIKLYHVAEAIKYRSLDKIYKEW